MTVQVASADFRRAIAVASKVIERRGPIPILQAVRCHANGAFEVTATDLDITVTARVSRDPGEDADFVLRSPRSVAHAIGAAGGKALQLSHKDGKAAISSDALEVAIDTMPADDFPTDQLRPISNDFSATFPAAAMAALQRVAGAMSTEETRYYLNGVRLKKVGETLFQLQATDGYRLYLCDVELPDAKGNLGANIIIPRKAVRLLVDLAKSGTDGLRMTIGSPAAANRQEGIAPERAGAQRLRAEIAERSADVSLVAKLIDGTFPDVEKVVPAGGERQVLFNVAALRRALAAVSGHSSVYRAVKISLSETGAEISAAYVVEGLAVTVKVPCEHNSTGFEIGFNGRYLGAVLDAAAGEEIALTMTDPTGPVLIRNTADSAWTGVLMPMRFK